MGVVNAKQFARTLREHARNRPRQLVAFAQRELAEALNVSLVGNTPVDRGDLRGGYIAAVNDDPGEGATRDPDGGPTVLRLNRVAQQIRGFDLYRIRNRMRYWGVVNSGGFVPRNPGPSKDPRPHRKGRVWVVNGYSTQAPQGMSVHALRSARQHFTGVTRRFAGSRSTAST